VSGGGGGCSGGGAMVARCVREGLDGGARV